MRYSLLFGKATKNQTKDDTFISHQLLTKAGFIAESTAGRYFFLPLGWRVHDKIKAVIKKHMDAAGAQEMLSPTLHPLELWQETNRTNTTGFELMQVKDRRGAEFALGGTAEEMFVDVVRNFQLSHKDLPFNLYQFSNKFRDEARARGGLLRVREFIMKDAYSFHVDAADFKDEYNKMAQVYTAVFTELGLDAKMVPADNGYIGGEYCHEFLIEHPKGEGKYFVSEDESYNAHEDIAIFKRDNKNLEEELKEYQEVEAVRGTTMEDGVELHGLPLWQQIKDVLFADEKDQLILAIIRGDLAVNETKLLHLSGAAHLRPATVEEVRQLGSEPGFISPVGLEDKLTIIADTSLRTIKNAYGGANKLHRDALNVNIDRDYTPHIEGDIAMAEDGFLTEDGSSKLIEKRGVEVGNIFQLGYHYSEKMKGATYIDAKGKAQPYYMGCYGIGLGRTMATIVENYHDDRGIIWPQTLAPFQVHLVSIGDTKVQTEEIYTQLQSAGVEVLWDDRDASPGLKLGDADLIGCPVRLVVSPKTGDRIEWKRRDESDVELLTVEEVLMKLSV